jgi:hypothetical protein
MEMVQLNVKIPIDIRTKFKQRCIEEKINYSEKAEELIRSYLGAKKK